MDIEQSQAAFPAGSDQKTPLSNSGRRSTPMRNPQAWGCPPPPMDSARGIELKVGTDTQADLDRRVLGHTPQQSKAAVLGGEHVAHLAGESTRAIDHHPALTPLKVIGAAPRAMSSHRFRNFSFMAVPR
jgi:hypothetical protein